MGNLEAEQVTVQEQCLSLLLDTDRPTAVPQLCPNIFSRTAGVNRRKKVGHKKVEFQKLQLSHGSVWVAQTGLRKGVLQENH